MRLPCIKDLFDLERTNAATLLSNAMLPYEPISKISEFIKCTNWRELGYTEIFEGIFAARGAKIAKEAVIIPPVIIGEESEIRPFAFIRGNVIIGRGAVIGNSTELKSSIVFDEAQLPHYNYVGDSILGHRSHLGAGAILSNFRLDKKNIKIKNGDDSFDTGYRKLGALVGDFVEIGAGSVINPGSIIGRSCVIYPLTKVLGVLKEKTIYKGDFV